MRNYVVVAESIRARIFSSQTNLGPLTEINDLVNPAGRLDEKELDADKQGRGRSSFGSSHAVGKTDITKNHETVVFAKQIADYMEEQRVAGNFDGLVLVGSPQFLGVLRKSLSENCKKMVTKSLDKNLVHAGVDEIREQVTR